MKKLSESTTSLRIITSKLVLLCLSIMANRCTCVSGEVSVTLVRSDAISKPSIVYIKCNTPDTEDVTFWRRVDGMEEIIQPVISDSSLPHEQDQLAFDLTPELEGVYFCKSGNERSSNEFELVAKPVLNKEVAMTRSLSVNLGETAILNCAYPVGVLSNHYTIRWLKGTRKLVQQTGLTGVRNDRYKILDNFSLVINSTRASDSGLGYQCSVTVATLDGNRYDAMAPSIGLEVYDPLVVTESAVDFIERPSDAAYARFTCSVKGSPEPTIAWFHKGRQVQNGAEERYFIEKSKDPLSTTTSYEVTSTMIVYMLEVSDSGQVSCVAGSSDAMALGGRPTSSNRAGLVTSTANLVVLPNVFTVDLQAMQDGSVQLKATLPTTIPGIFTLVVRYIPTASESSTTYDTEFIDTSFVNAREISYNIPVEKLPSFGSFQVQVALKVGVKQGGFTGASNFVSVLSPPTQDPLRDCPASDESNSTFTTGLIVVVVVLVIVVLVAISVVVVIVTICFMKERSKNASVMSPNPSEWQLTLERKPNSRGNSFCENYKEHIYDRVDEKTAKGPTTAPAKLSSKLPKPSLSEEEDVEEGDEMMSGEEGEEEEGEGGMTTEKKLDLGLMQVFDEDYVAMGKRASARVGSINSLTSGDLAEMEATRYPTSPARRGAEDFVTMPRMVKPKRTSPNANTSTNSSASERSRAMSEYISKGKGEEEEQNSPASGDKPEHGKRMQSRTFLEDKDNIFSTIPREYKI